MTWIETVIINEEYYVINSGKTTQYWDPIDASVLILALEVLSHKKY